MGLCLDGLKKLPGVSYKVLRIIKFVINCLPPIAVSILFGWGYYYYVFQYGIPLIQHRAFLGIVLVGIFNVLIILCFWSFYYSVFIRPPFLDHLVRGKK
jgi:hypothetical protein